MKIQIGGIEVNVKSCSARELQNGTRFLHIAFLQSEIEYAALKELLAANTGEIILTKDDDTKRTFSGYTFTPEVTDKEEEDGTKVYFVVIKCVAEAERQALEAKAKAAELEQVAADQAKTINTLTATVESLNQQMLILQLAAAELYEKTLPAESMEETTEEPAEETTKESDEESSEEVSEETTKEPAEEITEENSVEMELPDQGTEQEAQ